MRALAESGAQGDVDPDEAVVGGVDERLPRLVFRGPVPPGDRDLEARRRQHVVASEVAGRAVAKVGSVKARLAAVADVRRSVNRRQCRSRRSSDFLTARSLGSP